MGITFGSMGNYAFRLHYPFTVCILNLFFLLLTREELVGRSFSCVIGKASEFSSEQYIDDSCYASALYKVPWEGKAAEQDPSKHPTASEADSTDRSHIYYYRWVNLVLLVQAFLFSLSHQLWTNYDRGFTSSLTFTIRNFADEYSFQVNEKKTDKDRSSVTKLADFLIRSMHKHRSYAFMHIFCEILNLIVPVISIVWLVHFFQITGAPYEVGPNTRFETWDDFEAWYFPPLAKCLINDPANLGITGRTEALCSLPLNKLHMFIYLFLFAWYAFLAVFSGVVVLLTFMKFTCISCRSFLLRAVVPSRYKHSARSVAHFTDISDFFVLSQVRKNMHPHQFGLLIEEMEKQWKRTEQGGRNIYRCDEEEDEEELHNMSGKAI